MSRAPGVAGLLRNIKGIPGRSTRPVSTGACPAGGLGAGLAYELLNSRRGDSRRLGLRLVGRLGVLVADLVGLVCRGVLPRDLAPLRPCLPRRHVPRLGLLAGAEIQGIISGKKAGGSAHLGGDALLYSLR